MPSAARKGDKDSAGHALVEGSSTVNIGDSSGSPSFSSIDVTLPEEYNVKFATPVIQAAGRYAAFDEPGDIKYTPSDYPEDTKPDDYDGEVKQDAEVQDEEKPTPDLGDCMEIDTPINYDMKLSENYTIADLSTRALFDHKIQPQVGLSVQEIVCNLQALTENIIEPLRAEFGAFRINSGFRKGSGRSQHNKGQAVDIQEPTWSNEKHLEVAKWILQNLPCDQLIFEHGNAIWLHISFDRNKSSQRGQALTMINGSYPPGLKLYY